jgi:succinate-acetate transporter protein
MNRLKLLRFLFVLFTVLTVVFGIGLIVPENRDNTLGRVGLWCGFIAMLVDAILSYTEIRKIKKGEDS